MNIPQVKKSQEVEFRQIDTYPIHFIIFCAHLVCPVIWLRFTSVFEGNFMDTSHYFGEET